MREKVKMVGEGERWRTILLSSACCLIVCLASFAAEKVNPVLDLFPRDVTFHLDFNDGTVNPVVGLTEIRKDFDGAALEDGLFGKACVAGWFRYMQDERSPLIDTTRPGTVVCWVKLRREAPQVDVGKREMPLEPGANFFHLDGPDQRFLTFRKSFDLYWKSGAIWFLHGGLDHETGKRFQSSAQQHCSFVGWQVGEWRMMAAAWTADALYVSVNGRPYSKAMCTPLVAMTRPLWLRVNNIYDKKNRSTNGLVAIDEFTIFSKKLSETELKDLYERTKKAAGLIK